MRTLSWNIPEPLLEGVEKKVATINKRAAKYGCPPLVIAKGRAYFEEAEPGKFVKVIPVEVSGEMPVVSGWKFIARLEHKPTGNVVRNFSDVALPDHYRFAEPDCDHCGFNRKRNDTYIVEGPTGGYDEDGEPIIDIAQVGSTCLKDYTGGKSVDSVFANDRLWRDIEKVASEAEVAPLPTGPEHYGMNTFKYLIHAVEEIKENGFVKRMKGYHYRSTADRAFTRLNDDRQSTREAVQRVAKILAWINSTLGNKPTEELSEYEHNVLVVATHEVLEHRHIGIAASIPEYYRRQVEAPRDALNEAVDEELRRAGRHFVTKGDPVSLALKCIRIGQLFTRGSWSGYPVDLVDRGGRCYTVWAPAVNHGYEVSAQYVVIGTVKNVRTYKGIESATIDVEYATMYLNAVGAHAA